MTTPDPITTARQKTIEMSEELYEFYPVMSAQNHADEVRKYAAQVTAPLLAELEKLKAAKWDVRHTDTMNDMVAMGLARDAAYAEIEKLKAERDEAQEAADEAPWPQWADDIRKKLMEFGYDAGPEGEWNIGESFEDWMEGTFGEYERQKDAEITRLTSKLEQADDLLAEAHDTINQWAPGNTVWLDCASQWIKDRQAKTGEGL